MDHRVGHHHWRVNVLKTLWLKVAKVSAWKGDKKKLKVPTHQFLNCVTDTFQIKLLWWEKDSSVCSLSYAKQLLIADGKWLLMNIKARVLSVQTNIHFAHCVCVFLTLNGPILVRDATFLQTQLPSSLPFYTWLPTFLFTFYLFPSASFSVTSFSEVHPSVVNY